MLKLISWNVNGIRACQNKGGLKQVLTEQNPDILCLQEVRAQPEQIDLIDQLQGYQAVWNVGCRAGYSGTLIFTRLPFKRKILDLPPSTSKNLNLGDQFGDCNQEGRVITLEFGDFYLVTVYTPNSKGDLSRLPMRLKTGIWPLLVILKSSVRKSPFYFAEISMLLTKR